MVLSDVKAAEKAPIQARNAATNSLHDIWKVQVAHWKVAADDLERIKKGLAEKSSDFKVKLADLHAAGQQRIPADAEKSM